MLALDLKALLSATLDRHWSELCRQLDQNSACLDLDHFRLLPGPLRKLAVGRALQLLTCQRDSAPGLTRKRYDSVSDLGNSPVGVAVCLGGGFTARREHGCIYISRRSPAARIPDTPLPVPGEARLDSVGLRIAAEAVTAVPEAPLNVARRRGDREAAVSFDALQLPLTVRSRRPGDRLHPLGAPGERKLKDFLIARKVPRHERDRTPLVVDAAGRIVWVVGYEIADPFKLTGEETSILRLKLETLEPAPGCPPAAVVQQYSKQEDQTACPSKGT